MAGRTGSVMAATGRRIPRERRGEVQRRKPMEKTKIEEIMRDLDEAGFPLTDKEARMIRGGLSEGRTINVHLTQRMGRDATEIWNKISEFQKNQSGKRKKKK